MKVPFPATLFPLTGKSVDGKIKLLYNLVIKCITVLHILNEVRI